MNIYDAKSGHHLTKVDLNQDYYAIASNGIDKIAVGGQDKQVDIHTLKVNAAADECFNLQALEAPVLALKFKSAVQRIQWVGKYILAFSEDSEAQLFNTETEQVVYFRPGHEGSVLNGAIDP